jgi:eukaryotic-like serine/threonine-protein kinase
MATEQSYHYERLVGKLINGRYQITNQLGEGGMGAVFRAIDLQWESDVAVKVVSPELASNPIFLKRFRREARVGEVLTHPNIIKVFEYGEMTDGLLFMVMEFVSGQTLRKQLNEQKRFNPAQTLEILEPLCDALALAHSRNLLHRDLKPANVLIGDDKIVKLADFGIVKLTSPDKEISGAAVLTGNGEIFGTPQYMSPEQLLGHDINATADIFSVGIMTYEMLTGDLPTYAAELHTLMIEKMRGVGKISEKYPFLPSAFDALIQKTTRVDPEERYQNILDFLEDFRHAFLRLPTDLRTATAKRGLNPQLLVSGVHTLRAKVRDVNSSASDDDSVETLTKSLEPKNLEPNINDTASNPSSSDDASLDDEPTRRMSENKNKVAKVVEEVKTDNSVISGLVVDSATPTQLSIPPITGISPTITAPLAPMDLSRETSFTPDEKQTSNAKTNQANSLINNDLAAVTPTKNPTTTSATTRHSIVFGGSVLIVALILVILAVGLILARWWMVQN